MYTQVPNSNTVSCLISF